MSDEIPGEELPPGPTGPTFEERFASLEESNRALAADVRTLTSTLRVVNDLQKEQAEQRTRQDEADRKLISAKTEADERDARTRKIVGGVSLALAIVLPLVSMLVYFSLIQHVNELLQSQQMSFFKSCSIRNQATRDNIARELALADADKDKDVKQIHTASAQALSKSIVDCNQYLSK